MRGQTHRFRGLAAVGLLAVVGIVGFATAASATSGTNHSNGTVSLRTNKLGKVLVNSRGRTLYLFEKDKRAHSTCAGQCATYWPPLITKTKPTAGTGVKASLLGTTKRSDGTLQVTYNKHPLYLFVQDTAPGQANGENLKEFGAEWYALSGKGVKIESREHASPTATTPSTPAPTYTNTTNLPGY